MAINVLIVDDSAVMRAMVDGLKLIIRRELSPRPTQISNRLPLCFARLANKLAATDQSRTSGLVTHGPNNISSVCSMHMAMAGKLSRQRMWLS